MDPRAILIKLREGTPLTKAELFWFTKGLATGQVTDMQAGAFAMAVCTRGLTRKNRVHLTSGMLHSGTILRWDLPGPVLDKHSTGGVGDAVSLLLAPALAACGAYVPMISGRGLGHTGGTLDKLEAIPNYRTQVGVDEFQELVADTGCAIVGANPALAPADRRLYGVRDVTGTVESIDLITASILSKKLAAGLGALILDVKVGTGAFMASADDAVALARSLVETAQGAGCMCAALITDMNQPCARSAGTALEVNEVMDILGGAMPDSPLRRLTIALGGEILALGGLAADIEDGKSRIADALTSGQAMERFGAMVAALGGPTDFTARWRDHLPAARVILDVHGDTDGYVAGIDTRTLGEVVVHLGGGRLVATDTIDPAVGLSDIAPIGAFVDAERPLARIHATDAARARALAQKLRHAYRLAETARAAPPLFHTRIS
ncbi:MAG: thymidine phosphorylase [Rhodobacteraceae bacterium]|nr:thymidine phosphorylase [Paracoccaceae bacterium]